MLLALLFLLILITQELHRSSVALGVQWPRSRRAPGTAEARRGSTAGADLLPFSCWLTVRRVNSACYPPSAGSWAVPSSRH